MTGGRHILIAEEDTTLLGMLCEQLKMQKNFIINAKTGADVLELSKKCRYDVIILGSHFSDMDGREVCQKMRSNGVRAPIIMLVSAEFDSQEKQSLDSGANCFLKKPFRFGLLMARLSAYTRYNERRDDFVIQIGPYKFQPANNLLLNAVENKDVRLTDKEAAILQHLHQAGDRIVGRDILLDQVWGYNSKVTTHTLETHIYRLRQKIESDPTRAQILLTEPGGYRLVS